MHSLKKQDPTKIINTSINVDMFKHHFDIFVGDKEACKKAILKKYGLEDNEDNFPRACEGECISIPNNKYASLSVIWVSEPNIELITHEMDHAVTESLGISGINQGPSNQEIHAYYLGWIIGEVFKFFFKKGIAPCV
jgi:hypothetical protein